MLTTDSSRSRRRDNHSGGLDEQRPHLTVGEAADCKAYDTPIALPEWAPRTFLANKGYDAEAIRADLANRNIKAVLPGRSNRRVKIYYDRTLYKQCNQIERFFGRLTLQPGHRPPRQAISRHLDDNRGSSRISAGNSCRSDGLAREREQQRISSIGILLVQHLRQDYLARRVLTTGLKRITIWRRSMHELTSGNTAPEWSSYLMDMDAAGQRVVARLREDATAADRHDVYSMMTGALASAYFTIVMSNPDHPEFAQWLGLYQNILAPNPDTIYLNTSINGVGTYRIIGNIGSALMVMLQVQGPSQMVTGAKVPALADYELTEIADEASGDFELILSPQRPSNYQGEWRPLDPGAGLLMVRLVSDDWAARRDPVIAIERIDIPSRAGRRNADSLDERMKMIAPYIENTATRWIDHVQSLRADGIVNALKPKSYSFVGGIPAQSYYEGIFEFGIKEALILETKIPEHCYYWSVILIDMMFSTLDWSNNQSSLNRTQALLDSDGFLRIVIAHSDPGVPNWLDTVDRSTGIIQGRWAGASSSPLPTIRRVSLSNIRKYLPEDTPIVTPEDRDKALRARRQSYQFRRKW